MKTVSINQSGVISPNPSLLTALEPSLLDTFHRLSQSRFRRTDGHPDIPFAWRTETVARSRHNSCFLQQVGREGSGRVSRRHRDPDVEGSRWRIHLKPE